MLAKHISSLKPIPAADYSLLREVLHPDRDPVTVRFSLAHAVVNAGESSLRHRLDSVEVYYFLEGSGTMHVGGESLGVSAGHTVAVPAKAVQWVDNTGETPLAFLCIVDPAWCEEGEEVLG